MSERITDYLAQVGGPLRPRTFSILFYSMGPIKKVIQPSAPAMVGLNHFRLDEIIREILRVFPDHDGIF